MPGGEERNIYSRENMGWKGKQSNIKNTCLAKKKPSSLTNRREHDVTEPSQ